MKTHPYWHDLPYERQPIQKDPYYEYLDSINLHQPPYLRTRLAPQGVPGLALGVS